MTRLNIERLEQPDLFPCPFCGAPGYFVELVTSYVVKCTDSDCTARGRESTFRSDAVRAWNRRATAGVDSSEQKRKE